MKWRVRGSLGEKRQTSVLVEAPDAHSALSTAQKMGLDVLGVELEETPSVEPGAPPRAPVEVQLPVLIERTGKRWKAMLGVSSLLVVLGMSCAGLIVARQPRAIGDWPVGLLLSLAAAALGLVGIIWARLGAWWHHG